MTIEERVERLETQNRWMTRVGCIGLASIGVVLLVAQAGDKELPRIEVKSLSVRDDAGKERVTLSPSGLVVRDETGRESITLDTVGPGPTLVLTGKDGKGRVELGGGLLPHLRLMDAEGKARADLAVLADSTVLSLRDATENERVQMGIFGFPYLSLWDGGKARIKLGVPANGLPELLLLDGAGNKRATLRLLADGNPLFSLEDAAGKAHARLAVPGLGFHDAAGKLRTSLGLMGGSPSLALFDREERGRVHVGVVGATDKLTGTETEGGTLAVSDSRGSVIWDAPK